MPIPKAQTVLIDLSKTELAEDARPHDPAALEILAHDMGEQGQLQEIIVEKRGAKYVVIAGVGRTLAARKLGWKEIRASVREKVSDFDKARITFAENEDREDADAFYQAKLIVKMLSAKGGKQTVLAQELGLSVGLVSAYIAIDNLPAEIGRSFKRLKLGQLIQIARLNRAETKIEFAELCAKRDLSVRQLKSLINRTLKKSASGRLGRSAVSASPAVSDPLAKLWEKLHNGMDLPMEVWWESHYGIHKVKDGPELTGHFFFVSPQPEFSAPALAAWFKGIAKALEATSGSAPSVPGTKLKRGGDLGQVASSIENLGTGTNNVPKVLDIFQPRIPKNAAEHAELANLSATKGPKAVYAWIYGANSPMTQAVPVNTWNGGNGDVPHDLTLENELTPAADSNLPTS